MADTLEKIYDNTLTDTSFDANGEATIITTNSSTRHVIKDIKIIEGDADIPVSGTLQENGHDLVGLTANSSGSEIIGTSSTVKVKTSNLPFTYTDDVVRYQTTSSNIQLLKVPFINGISGKATNQTTDISHSNYTSDSTWRQYWSNIGPNENDVYHHNDRNSTQLLQVRNSSGSSLFSYNNNYRRSYFDGSQYAYYLHSSYLYRVDTHPTSGVSGSTYINESNLGSYSTYPELFGYRDEYAIGWTAQNTSAFVFDLQNATSRRISTNAATAFANSGAPFGLIKKSDGTYMIIAQVGAGTLKAYAFDPSTTDFGGSAAPVAHTVTLNPVALSYQGSFAYIGSRVYYVASGGILKAVDFDPATPTLTTIGNHAHNSGGYDVWGVSETPDASTISGRTYNVSPSLKLRITGVTSA